MAKILYFDCFSGISGDMTLGALIDLGLDAAHVKREIEKLGVTGYDFSARKTQKYGITGTDVEVVLKEGRLHYLLHRNQEKCDALCDGLNTVRHTHEEERNFREISRIIQDSKITKRAKEMSIAIFEEIARAEAAVHGKTVEEVHFHEIGAVDSIVDIVGVAICLDLLKIDEVYCSPLHEGKGFVECRHGVLPIPVPAVAQMLQNSSITMIVEDIPAELVTPTGMGIVKTLAGASCDMPPMTIDQVGYGFGKRDTGKFNALRIFMGSLNPGSEGSGHLKPFLPQKPNNTDAPDRILVIETNIDDMTGEMLGFAMERLLEAGALDVYFTAIQMKKNRPATKLTVLCAPVDQTKMAEIILRETSTFGLRIYEAERIIMKRAEGIVETEFGPVRVKRGNLGDIEKTAPEYEDCARMAREQGLPITKIYEAVSRLVIDN